MTSKKKIWIIAAAVLIFAALATGATVLQNTLINDGSAESGSSLTPVGLEFTSSSSLASDGSSAESSAASSETSSTSHSAASSSKDGNTAAGSSSSSQPASSAASSSADASKPEPQGMVNFVFKDTVNKQTLLTIDFPCSNSGATVGDLTEAILKQNNILYSCGSSGASIYFKMMFKSELREKAPTMPDSGWIFGYKRSGESSFTRSTVGAGGVILHPGDSVEWRYMKNGR